MTRLVLSPDGKWLATGGLDGHIRLWDMSIRQPVLTISNRQNVGQLLFSPDGQVLAAREAERISLWARDSWKPIAEVSERGTPVATDPEGMAFAPDAPRLVYSKRDGTIVLWNWRTQSEEGQIPGEGAYVSNLSISPDGHLLVAGDLRGVVQVWSLPNRQPLARFGEPQNKVAGSYEIKFSPHGQLVAMLVAQNILIYETQTWKQLATLQGHSNAVANFVFTHDSQRLITYGKEGAIKVWDANQRQDRQAITKTSDNGFALSRDGAIVEWQRVSALDPGWEFSVLQPPSLSNRRKVGVYGRPVQVSFPRAGGPIAMLQSNDVVQVVQPGEARTRAEWKIPGCRRVELSPDGRLLIESHRAPGIDNRQPLGVWDVSRSNRIGQLDIGRGTIGWMEFTPDGSKFVVGFWYGEGCGLAEVWDVAQQSKIATFGKSSSPLGGLRFTLET